MKPALRSAHHRPRLLVAGGGIGGIESLLALRSMCGDVAAITLVSAERTFVFRPMTVAEPFGFADAVEIDLPALCERRGVGFHQGRVARVDPSERELEVIGGDRLGYDALIVATGARPEPWLDGALTFAGRAAVARMRALLGQLESGEVSEIVFTAPVGASWTLPLYELALLTSAWCADRALTIPRLHIITPELQPLDLFGAAAGRLITELLADRGILLRTAAEASSFSDGIVRLAGGGVVLADAVVALPVLRGNPVPGLPADPLGFVPVDDHGRVAGAPEVYAVGDATSHTIKQGGLAAQQADVAAASIAHGLGLPAPARAYRPLMRGMLLTGLTSAFLRSGPGDEAAAFSALWWPPAKVAGRHLAGLLTDLSAEGPDGGLLDRPVPRDLDEAARDRAEMRALALQMAVADAQWDDFESAARWLQTVEWLDGVLPTRMAQMRDAWAAKAAARR